MAKLLRKKSKTLVAFGSCAQEGCVPGLANLLITARKFSKRLCTDHILKTILS